MEHYSEKKEFSIIKRAKSFTHAGRGVWFFLKTTHNAWIHVALFVLAICLGVYCGISRIEWILLVFAGGFVLVSEAFNTAIEIDMDLTSPEHHPYARDTKDVAAGAVLLSACTALVVGILIFGQYLF
ncbi:diacylglycerol kinase family protein [Candidatus Campbellbacteria bacterium]|nr:MAG: diacylglycerol kinase family protein [Candidatus Campbellbacteria bacterium]